MIRSFRFDNDDRELTVSELSDHSGVEIRVGGLPFVFGADEWIAFAKLVQGSISKWQPDLLVNLGRTCGECQGSGDATDDPEVVNPDPCSACSGRGWLPGEPDPKPKAPAKTTPEDGRPF